eukprot:5913623-Pyramimonas_sp.AAC.1
MQISPGSIGPQPPGDPSASPEVEEAGTLLTERLHTCPWEDVSGFCGATFSCRSGLANHARIVHNIVKLSHALTLTNQCIVCEEVFGERLTACKHLEGALFHGRCLRNKASTIAELVVPGVLVCRVCGSEHRCLREYNLHARSHLLYAPFHRCGHGHGRRGFGSTVGGSPTGAEEEGRRGARRRAEKTERDEGQEQG